MKKERLLISGEILFSIFSLLIILFLIRGQVPGTSYHPVKAAALSVYYFLFYTGSWFDAKCLLLSAVTIWIALKVCSKNPSVFHHALGGALLSTAAVAVCFFLVVYRIGNIGSNAAAQTGLQIISLIWWELCLFGMTGHLRHQCSQKEKTAAPISAFAVIAVLLLLFLSCIPIILVGKYVYPQGDDFEYGIYCYQAWRQTGNVFEVFKGAWKMVLEGFFNWQGTFSSIFLMALHPGIWGTEYYHLVPLLLLCLPLSSLLFFFWTILRRLLGASRAEAVFVSGLTAFLVIQLPISKASAFFWYNGAIHYMGAFSFLLFYLSFLLYAVRASKRKGLFLFASCIAGIMVGGGNLVTALIGTVLTAFLAAALCFLKARPLHGLRHPSDSGSSARCLPGALKTVLIPGLFLLAAFAVNILAPGNALRQAQSGPVESPGVVLSILQSFQICMDNALTEWTDWFWLLLLLAFIPVFRNVAAKADFDFPLPGLVPVMSFCLLSAMYTPSLFALGEWRIGRIQNITYEMFLILSVLNELYLIGWLSKHRQPAWNSLLSRKYYAALSCIGALLLLLTAVAAPGKMTFSAACDSVRSGQAQTYASVIKENIDLLESSSEDFIRVKEPPREPEIFVNSEIETWRSGAASYYGKTAVRYFSEEY